MQEMGFHGGKGARFLLYFQIPATKTMNLPLKLGWIRIYQLPADWDRNWGVRLHV